MVGPLKKIFDPEHKRQIIGDVFMQCKDLAIQRVINFENIHIFS